MTSAQIRRRVHIMYHCGDTDQSDVLVSLRRVIETVIGRTLSGYHQRNIETSVASESSTTIRIILVDHRDVWTAVSYISKLFENRSVMPRYVQGSVLVFISAADEIERGDAPETSVEIMTVQAYRKAIAKRTKKVSDSINAVLDMESQMKAIYEVESPTDDDII